MISSKREVVPAWDDNNHHMTFTYGFRLIGELPAYCSDREWYVTESLGNWIPIRCASITGINRGKWTVTDAETGCTIGRFGMTRKEAIARTCALLRNVDRETLLAKVRKALKIQRSAVARENLRLAVNE